MPTREARVTLIGDAARAPDVVIMGSHDIALDVVVGALAERGFSARTIAVGSQGGVAAAQRGQCDVAPVHLIDPASGEYNKHLLSPGLVAGAKAGSACRACCSAPATSASKARRAEDAVKAALADPSCLMVNRNAGAGTRVLIDQLARGRAAARLRQPAALAQRRRRRGRAGARRLGRRDRAGGADVRARLPAARARALRFPAGRKPARAAGGAGVPRGAARPPHKRTGSRRSGCNRPMTRIALAFDRALLLALVPRRRNCAATAGRCARSRSRPTARPRSPAASTPRRSAGRSTRNAAEQVLRFHESAVNAVALAARWPHRHRRRGRQDRDLAAGRAGAASGARGSRRADRQRSRCRRTARRWRRRRGIAPSGCGRSRAARRACSKAISRTSTASPSRRTARRWSARLRPDAAHLAARRRRADRRDAADAAQCGRGRAATARSSPAAPTAGCSSSRRPASSAARSTAARRRSSPSPCRATAR